MYLVKGYHKGLVFLLFLTGFLLIAITGRGQYAYNQESAGKIIRDIQQKTNYRFLYRESLVSQLKLSFSATDETIFEQLRTQLNRHQLRLNVDSTRKQALVYKSDNSFDRNETRQIQISGYIVDATSGERLPYATIIWEEDGRKKGTTTNSAGYFNLKETVSADYFPITASYVGYGTRSVNLETREENNFNDLTISLKPELLGSNEIVVTGKNFYMVQDTSIYNFVDIGTFSPLGESNSIRALQMLPSVGLNPALSTGINVRGSPVDGFHVLLDGIKIFNQSHLFGLLDSFNSDALRRSNLFYDIVPAQYQSPPGGILSLNTRDGSTEKVVTSVGVSNSSVKATVEGPFKKGNSSWLISGRHSYMDKVDWLNNKSLVGWGLDINRNREVLNPDFTDLESRLVTPGNYNARFFDLHGKFQFEGQQGNRFIISGYIGGDNTDQLATRLVRDVSNAQFLEQEEVETSNDWGNFAASILYESTLSERVFSRTLGAISVYETNFSKDDFTYTRNFGSNDPSNNLVFVQPFANKSIVNEIKAEQAIDVSFDHFLWSVGGSYQYYLYEYFEESFERANFFINGTAHKADAFMQLDLTGINPIKLNVGSRVHYYSNGNYIRWSPRAKLQLFPDNVVSLSVGYSKNYQYLHQINLDNVISADVWVLSTEEQPPGELDYLTSGIYINPVPEFYFQAEGYLKYFENLRLHEINTQSLSNTFQPNPWFFNNDGFGSGLEFLLRNRFRYLSLTQTFTWSRMEMKNEAILQGKPFLVDWDRTYRYTSSLGIFPIPELSLYLSWIYATGTPNKLAVFGSDDQLRLDDYYRTDLTVEYKNNMKFGSINLAISFYNLFDRQNPWYRENTLVVDRSRALPRLRAVPVNVFDLGFQPSFEVSVTF